MKILMMILLFFSIIGCDSTLVRLQEPTFKQGCYVSNIGAKVGIINQEGSGEMFKLKCSEELPENYCYEVNNQATGIRAKVGSCD